MRVSTVYACVRIIAGTIACLPIQVFQKTGSTPAPAPDHPFQELLNQPNEIHTGPIFWQDELAKQLLRGNSYSVIGRTRAGRVLDLSPLQPEQIAQVERVNGRLQYRINLLDGRGVEILDQRDVLHVPGLSFNGITGFSPIRVAAREAVGLALATEEHGARFFSNGARPNGVLETASTLDPAVKENIRANWRRLYGGLANAHEIAVLSEDLKYKPISITNEDAQYLETRRFQVEDIARIFGVPQHLLQSTEKATTWGSGLEEQNIAFVIFTLAQHIKRNEAEINRKLFGGTEFFARFNLKGLLRGAPQSRAAFYASGIQNGWLMRNEAREKEDLEPKEGLDEPLIPNNMAPRDAAGQTGGNEE